MLLVGHHDGPLLLHQGGEIRTVGEEVSGKVALAWWEGVGEAGWVFERLDTLGEQDLAGPCRRGPVDSDPD